MKNNGWIWAIVILLIISMGITIKTDHTNPNNTMVLIKIGR